jgi:hypothetical protein
MTLFCPQCKKEVVVKNVALEFVNCDHCDYQFANTDILYKEFWTEEHEIPIKASYLTLMSVHGNLCLALRHPNNNGASRKYTVEFVKFLGEYLVHVGALTQEQLTSAQYLEAEEGSEDFELP